MEPYTEPVHPNPHIHRRYAKEWCCPK